MELRGKPLLLSMGRVTNDKIPYQKIQGRYYFLESDVNKLLPKQSDTQEAISEIFTRISSIEQEIEALKLQVSQVPSQLEQRLAELERNAQSAPGPPTAQPPPTAHKETAKPSEGHYKSNRQRSQKEPLPDGYIASERFAKDHGVPVTTMRAALATGRLQAEENNWIVGRASVRVAFNYVQQVEFVLTYRTNEHFHRCNNQDCPCQQDSQQ